MIFEYATKKKKKTTTIEKLNKSIFTEQDLNHLSYKFDDFKLYKIWITGIDW